MSKGQSRAMVLRVVFVVFTVTMTCAAIAAVASAKSTAVGRTPHVVCWFNQFNNWHERTRPRTCNVRLGYQHKYYRLRHMRWDRWNSDSAHGRGRDLRGGGGSYPVRVELWKPRHGYPHDKLYYSKARVSIGHRTNRFSLAVPRSSHFF